MAQITKNTPNTLIGGTEEADLLQNAHNGTNVTIEGYGGADSLQNWGTTVTVNGGADDDNIYNDSAASDAVLNGNAGNDIITNKGNKVTMNGGDGNDALYNEEATSDVLINGGNDSDTVQNSGNNVTVNGDAGKDTLLNWGTKVTINGGDDNDLIYNDSVASDVLINGGKGADTVQNIGNQVTINGDAGDDYFTNTAKNVTIDGGAGNDFAANGGSNVAIIGGDDNDTVHNEGAQVTVNAGAGSDSLQNNGAAISVDMGAGTDIVNNFGASATINGGDDNDTLSNWQGGDYTSINGGKGNDSLYNRESTGVTLNGGDDADSLFNMMGSKGLLDGGSGDDAIENGGTNMSIVGGAGNDTLLNKTVRYSSEEGVITVSPAFATLDGGADNDYLYNDADNVSMIGGAGNDSVVNAGGSAVSMTGGAGNDTLTGSTAAEVFIYSGGNDVITNYSGDDTVKIASGKLGSVNVDDGDVVFKIGNGTLRLKDMQGRVITLTDSAGKTTAQSYGETGYTGQEVIKNFVKALRNSLLTDNPKLDEAIKLSTHFDGIQDAIDHMLADCKAAGDADTFLRKYCGIILDNDDTGAISGWDAGGASVIIGDNIVGETLETLKHPDYTDTTFKAGDLTIHIGSTGDTLDGDGKKIFDGIYSWWADEAVRIIEDNYGVTFSDSDSINIAMVPTASFAGNTRSDGYMQLNQAYHKFNSDDDYNGNGADRTFVHEMTHAAQYFLMGGSLPQFLMEGMADLTHGIDDRTGGKSELMPSLAGDASELAKYLDLTNNDTGEFAYYVAGYMFYRYLARQASMSYDSLQSHAWQDGAAIGGTDDADFLTGNGAGSTITAGGGNDSITAYGANMIIVGDGGDDSIINAGENASVSGGEGYDYIENHAEGATLAGGVDDDSINNLSNGVLAEGGDGDDFIQNEGDDVTLAGGKGKDTINNVDGANVVFRYVEGDGGEYISGFNETSTLEIKGDYGGSIGSSRNMLITVGDDVITLVGARNLSKVNITQPWKIVGTEDADKINNTLDGATVQALGGNDTITNTGANLLVEYSAGNDVINGFKTDSTLKLGDGSATYSKETVGNNVVVTVGDNAITLTGAASLDTANIIGKEVITKVKYTDSDAYKQTLGAGIGTGDASARTKAIYLVGNASDNTLTGGSNKDTIYGKDGDDYIEGGAGNDYLSGQNGNDTLSGGEGNDTLKGDAGNDLFLYTGGNDFIADMSATDTLQLGDGTAIYSKETVGSNLVLSVGGNTITLNGAASLETVNIVGVEKVTTVKYTDSDAGRQTLVADIETGDASARTKAISLVGNALANTLLGGTGNDTILGKDGDDYIEGGAGDDYLSGQNGNDTLSGGSGNDTVYGGAGDDLFIYTGGNDFIGDLGATDTLQLGDGTLEYSKATVDKNIVLTVGDNTVTLKNASTLKTLNIIGVEKVTALTITDNDANRQTLGADIETGDATARTKAIYIVGNALANSIVGGSGSDSIYGKDGDDYISGGAGNDYLNGQTGNDTLAGGDGNDTLKGDAGNDLFLYTGGNDLISDMSATDTLQIGDGSATYSKATVGKNIVLTVGDNKVTLNGAASLSTLNILGTEVNTLATYTDDDADKQTLQAGIIAGDASSRTQDIWLVGNALDNSMVGGLGNDSLLGKDGDDYIEGGAGNDYLSGQNGNDTLGGGEGNDTVYGGAGDDLFIYTGGNDLIGDMSATDTLQIGDGSLEYYKETVGKNIVLTVGDNVVTLKNAATLSALNIVGKDTTITDKDADKKTLSAGIKTGNASARTNAIYLVGNALDNSIIGGSGSDSLYGKDGDDYLAGNDGDDYLNGQNGNDTLAGGAGNDTLKGDAGNDVFIYTGGNDFISDMSATDTLQIGDGTATYSKETVGKNVVVTVGDNAITLNGAASLDTVNILGKEVITKVKYTDDDADRVTFGSGIETGDASARTKAIYMVGNALDNSMVGGAGQDTLYGKDGDDYMEGGTGNDYLSGQNGNDTLSGGEGNDTVYGGAGNDVFIYTGGNDFIGDMSATDTLQLGDGSAEYYKETVGKNIIVTVGDNVVTLNNAANLSELNIIGEEITTAAKFTNSSNAKQTLGAAIETADASARTTAIEIVGNAFDNSIVGGSKHDTLYGEDGNDTLVGGKGNDSLYGGAGADVFVYNDGDGSDVIVDYTVEDKIQIASGTVTATSANNADAVIAFTTGKITIKNAADKILNCEDEGKLLSFSVTPSTTMNSAGTAITLKSNYADTTFNTADYGAKLKTVDASAAIHGIYVTANTLANSILGSEYDDTLWGGKGNDTLKGGGGADVFIYGKVSGEGRDVIQGFGDDDMLQITGTFTGTYNTSTKAIALKVGTTTSAITLKDFTATTFNINGDTYRISGTKLVK